MLAVILLPIFSDYDMINCVMHCSTDVLVVGGGPVGLMLACELQRQGVDHLLVERTSQRSYFCKALGLTPRTLEIFEALGIVQPAIDHGVWLTGWTSFDNGQKTGSQDIQIEGWPYGFLALPQYETEQILEGCLKRHGGSVQYGLTLEGFNQGPDTVEAEIVDATGGRQKVTCGWLVGCDGARSTVRKGLGLEFEGDRYDMGFMLGDVEIDWDLPRGRAYRFQQTVEGQLRNVVVAIPIHGSIRRYRLSMADPDTIGKPANAAGVEANQPPTLERLIEVAGPILLPGTRVSNLRWSSVYRISHRIVPRYSVGRVFLAGDAAHIHPPIGGLGMNTGLQDAHNLSWKLTLAARGVSNPGILDSYSAERRPVGLDVVNETSRAMGDTLKGQSKQFRAEGRESQLFIHYRSSSLVRDDLPAEQVDDVTPRAGDRAPDAADLSRPFVGRRFRLRECLAGGCHALIGYSAEDRSGVDQTEFANLFEVLRTRFGTELAIGLMIVAPNATVADGEQIPLLTDTLDKFRQAYGARPGMSWLIRPDGYIAWRFEGANSEELARFVDQAYAIRVEANLTRRHEGTRQE
ncbi:MAG: FAD-dependent monooxygenase [Chthoniobacterales bacterium]